MLRTQNREVQAGRNRVAPFIENTLGAPKLVVELGIGAGVHTPTSQQPVGLARAEAGYAEFLVAVTVETSVKLCIAHVRYVRRDVRLITEIFCPRPIPT